MKLLQVPGWEIEAKLGDGGMGVVYKAKEVHTQQVVALKTLHYIDPAGIYRFKREFRTLSNVVHRNLVRLFELNCVNDTWFFTMELVEGCTFLEHLAVTPWRPEVMNAIGAEAPTLLTKHAEASASGLDSPRFPSAPPSPRLLDYDLIRGALLQLAEGLSAIHAETNCIATSSRRTSWWMATVVS